MVRVTMEILAPVPIDELEIDVSVAKPGRSVQLLEGTLRAGDMVYLPDPHVEHEMHTEHGCKILFVQYQGPTTGARPIYQGRFNRTERSSVAEEDLEH